MIVKRLRLVNIRSYTDANVFFQPGVTLISGDVGSGKSSLLLALEFALFGILRGEIPASHLLRHGQSEGRVELEFEVNNDSFTIIRELKKDSIGIKQGACSLTTNGVREPLTAVELKSRVFGILGYPLSHVSRAKNVLFRYTVFTPQLHMQNIVLESGGERLEVLRKSFCIDHYKTVISNISLLVREFKTESKALKLRLEDLSVVKHQLSKSQSEQEELNKLIGIQQSSFHKAREQLTVTQSTYDSLKDLLSELLRTHDKLDSSRTSLEQTNKRITQLEETLLKAKNLTEPIKPNLADDEPLLRAQKLLDELSRRSAKASEKLAVINSELSTINKFTKELESLSSTCPTCHQKVNEEHKTALCEQSQKKISTLSNEQEQLKKFLKEATDKQVQVNKKIQEHTTKLQSSLVLQARYESELKSYQQQKEQVHNVEKEHEELSRNREELKKTITTLKTFINYNSHAHTQTQQALKELQLAKQTLDDTSVQLARLQERSLSLHNEITRLHKEREKLITINTRAIELDKTAHWLSTFSQAVTTIEQAVFSSLHSEFEQLLSSWFDTLIEDESLQVRLDHDFSPLIIQNGYDSLVLSLSGGEKTALALAYRLSLNQIINEFVMNIHTRDLIILDEPTDGFSSKQLDKMRDVFDQLSSQQIILVSHEPRLEGLVEHIIRVHKDDVSRIVTIDI